MQTLTSPSEPTITISLGILIVALDAGLISINHEALLSQYAEILASAKITPVLKPTDKGILCAVVNHLAKTEAEEFNSVIQPNPEVIEKLREGMAEKALIEEAKQAPVPEEDPITKDSATENFKVVRVERTASKNNKRDQWMLSTDDGERIWLTKHDDDSIDGHKHILTSGYNIFFDDMKLGDVQRWQENPIRICATKNGKFWNIIEILPRFEDTPDSAFSFMPKRKQDIIQQVKNFTNGIVLDTETTGLGPLAQIVQIGMLNTATGEVYEKLIQPTVSVGEKARETHGITEEQLAEAWQFDKYADEVLTFLENDKTIIGFNIEFDLRLLEQTLQAHDLKSHLARLEEIKSTATIVDVKIWMENFIGDPYTGNAKFRYQSLADSAKFLDIPLTVTHNAYADAQTTWRIVEKLQSHTPDPLDAIEPVADYFQAF